MARILITCWGSHGDLFPYIGLALALKARGHAPIVATSPGFRANVEQEGLAFAPAGPAVDPDDRALIARVMDPANGSEVIVRELLLPVLRRTYEELRAAAAGVDLIVSHPITFAAPLLAEREALLWVSTVLAPLSLFSAEDPPVLPLLPRLNDVPIVGGALARLALPLARRTTRRWMGPVVELRAALGLPRGDHPLFEGQFSPSGTLALFSRVLASPQPDWPTDVTTTGAILYNGPDALSAELEEFLAGSAPPVVFTLGTSAVGAAGRFYHESAAAAAELGVRAVLLAGTHAQNRPTEPLPRDVLLVERAPHALLFPRASAVVHQVGAGTMAQALASGRPMLAVPHGHDQFDNARRITQLGVARTLFPRRYERTRVARELEALLSDARYRARAEATAAIVRQEGGADAAADAIGRLLT